MSDQEPMNGAAFPDTTGEKQDGEKPDTRFKPGESGNPNGRPLGSRNKINTKFLDCLTKDFDEHGEAAIVTMRTERPADYIKVVASLLPKQMEIEDKRATRRAEDLSDDELAAIATGKPQSNGANEQRPVDG